MKLVTAEVLEVRQVMTVTSPISPTAAMGDAAAAQSALTAARNGFATTMSGLEATLQGDYASHQNTADGSVNSAEALLDSNILAINNGLDAAIAGLTSGFDGVVDGHEATYDGALLSARAGFDSAIAGLNTALTGALFAAQSFFSGQLSLASGTLTSTIDGLRMTLDGIIATQQAASQVNIAGFNSAFDAFAAVQAANYDTQETGFWNGYLAATGSSPTGLQGVYDANVAAADATRDGLLSSYPNVIYDPAILVGTPAYDALINGANSTLDNDLLLAQNSYDSSVLGHLNAFDNAINGPGGATATFNTLMNGVNGTFDSAMQAADANYNSTMITADGLYNATVNGPGGLVDAFEANVAGFQSVYDSAVLVAEIVRSGLIDAAVDAFDAAVTAAELSYDEWLTGRAGTGVTTSSTVTHYQPIGFGGTESWDVCTTQTDSNGNSSSSSSTGLTSPPGAPGILISSTTFTTTIGGVSYTVTVETYQDVIAPTDSRIGNVFVLAIQDRTTWMEQTLDDLADRLETRLTGLSLTLEGQVSAANDAYNNLSLDPTTGFTTQYENAISAASLLADSNAMNHFISYQATIGPMMTGGIDVITMLPIPPNWALIDQETQDYSLRVTAEEIIYTDSVGTAFVNYVSAERAADTNHDLTIVAAINSYLQQAIIEVDGYFAAAQAEITDWMRDVTGIEADFERQDVAEFAGMAGDINTAAQSLGLAENGANEGFTIAESNAALVLTQSVATEAETLRNGEMGARITLQQAEASAAETWGNTYSGALAGWLTGSTNAQHQFTLLATSAEEQLQNGLLGDQVTFVGAATSAMQTWITTVSNGIASLWSAAAGGGSDVTAVANAWKSSDQSSGSEWKSFLDGEAGAFQTYGAQEAAARKSMQQSLSAQNVLRMGQFAGEIQAYNGVVGPALSGFGQGAAAALGPWMTTVAAAERTSTNNSASAINGFEVSAAPFARIANDGFVNATSGFIGNVTGDWVSYRQSAATLKQTAQGLRIGAFDTLAGSSRGARVQQSQDDRTSWNTFATAAAPAEDGVVSAWSSDWKAQAVLGAVTRFSNDAALAPSAFTGFTGQQRSLTPTEIAPIVGTRMNDNTAVGAVSAPGALNAAKPTVTVGQQGQIISSNLNLWQRTRLKMSALTNWESSERELAAAAGYAVIRSGQVMASVPPVPEPTPLKAIVPVTGSAQYAGYHLQQGNYGRAIFYEGMMVSDLFMVSSLAQTGGKFVLRNGARLWADEVGGAVVPRLLGGVADDAASAASRVAPQIDDVTRNFFGHGQTVTPPAVPPPTGQIHHAISTQIGRALETHPTLNGVFQLRDPRFTTQAANAAAHRGYQTWHRALDNEVVNWIRRNPNATDEQFLNYLRELYQRADLLDRFPGGF